MAEAVQTEYNNEIDNESYGQKIADREKTDYMSGLSYEKLSEFDKIDIELAPEKKGLFSTYQEYYVKSRRLQSCVERRYTDFESFHKLLQATYPYRLVPKLPPKKAIGADSQFIEERRKGLTRWLTLISQHPIISLDATTRFFLTYTGPKVHSKIQELFDRMPDEFTTSCIASKSKELVESVSPTIIASSRIQIQLIFSGITQLKKISERNVLRSHEYAFDMAEIGNQLLKMACDPHNASEWSADGSQIWEDTKRGFGAISNEFSHLYTQANNQALKQEEEVCQKLNLLLDILTAHHLLCERYEKGVAQDHQRALDKMLAFKKAKIQRSISRTDSEVLDQLEARMMEQEAIIANVEMRSAYFLHCMKLETQLVQVYLGNIAEILNSLIFVQLKGHSEMAEVWKVMQPKIQECLPDFSNNQ